MASNLPSDSRGPELAAVVISLLVFATITVALRCYTMGVLLRRFFIEDWLAVVTLFFYIAYSTFALLSIHYGLGSRTYLVPKETHDNALLFKYLAQVAYVLVAVLVKFIVGLFILRICFQQRKQRIAIWTMLGIVAVYNVVYIFLVIFQCRPIHFYWLRYDLDAGVKGRCHRTQLTCPRKLLATIPTYISFVMNVVVDWTLAFLPVSFVWHSKMHRKTKISVIGVLAIGSMFTILSMILTFKYSASLATCARIPYAKQLISNPDYLYNFTDLAIWSTVEIGLGLSASSLATLKPLFRKFKLLPAKLTSRNTSRPPAGYDDMGSHADGTPFASKSHSRAMSFGCSGSRSRSRSRSKSRSRSQSRNHSKGRMEPLQPRAFAELKNNETWDSYETQIGLQTLVEAGPPAEIIDPMGITTTTTTVRSSSQQRKMSISIAVPEPTLHSGNWSGNRSKIRNDDWV
ncbi:hypothetical protein HYFRA_00011099 [Hymenoscyphus fraxineus]|uniref:Rhodopsin domain-containing protein n=1 Tax=Hymenoscyphus fraxineus TaxID=746836 RepID=A0A9N9L7I6_9HELO|nr:hypothetical protein HYFRA_00011099 [Hymenoscyphus fraxineus]